MERWLGIQREFGRDYEMGQGHNLLRQIQWQRDDCKAEQLKKSAQDYRNLFTRYKPFLKKKAIKENSADAEYATWQKTWERAALTEFEAGLMTAFQSSAGNQKKRFGAVSAAHTRLVDFSTGDPSKSVACLWTVTQESLKWMEDKKAKDWKTPK